MREIRNFILLAGLCLFLSAPAVALADSEVDCNHPPLTPEQAAFFSALTDRDVSRALQLLRSIDDLDYYVGPAGCETPTAFALGIQNGELIGAMLRKKGAFSGDLFRWSVAIAIDKNEDETAAIAVLDALDSPAILSLENSPDITEETLAKLGRREQAIDKGQALILAERAKKHLIIAWLLKHGADVDQTLRCVGDDALQTAMVVNDVETVELLLDTRVHIEAPDRPLASAVFRGRPNIVALLLKRGANPDPVHASRKEFTSGSPLSIALTMASVTTDLINKANVHDDNLSKFEIGIDIFTAYLDRPLPELHADYESIAIQLKQAGAISESSISHPYYRGFFPLCD